MTGKHWTHKDIQYLTKKALLDSTNIVVNINQLAKHLKRNPSAVNRRIELLRREGTLPQIEREKAIDTVNRPYSDHAIKRIEAMLKNGSTVKEIAASLGKTESSINSLLSRLRKKGVVKTKKMSLWEAHEEEYVINNIRFDEHGYTINAEALANYLNRSIQSVTTKISKLRSKRLITVYADASKASVKAKQAHDHFNQKRFAEYGKGVSSVVITPNKVEVVQVVHTVSIGSNGEEIHQYWTFDGKLLAENKKRPLCQVT